MGKYWIILVVSFLSCGNPGKVIRMKGSDTEVNLAVNLAEAFRETDNSFSVSISGGGSGMGIASLLNGQADIANSSRPLSGEEKELFIRRGIPLKTVVFAEDATAFIVHASLPLDSISAEDLGKVFSGAISNWKSLSGKDAPITIYGRQSNSGTHSFVQKKLGIAFSRNAREMNGNAQIIEGVKMDASGIGYVGAGYIMPQGAGNRKDVKVLHVREKQGEKAVSPLNKAAILDGKYFFQRPLYQFIPVQAWEKVRTFIDFEQSKEGKALIEKEGYYIIETSDL